MYKTDFAFETNLCYVFLSNCKEFPHKAWPTLQKESLKKIYLHFLSTQRFGFDIEKFMSDLICYLLPVAFSDMSFVCYQTLNNPCWNIAKTEDECFTLWFVFKVVEFQWY